MAEIRWIKLTVNMFDDEKIRLIQAMPESDAILVIWIRLLSLAGKTNSDGQIYIDENMAYSDEMLSTLFNKPVNIIRLALQTLKSFGMIDIFNNGVIFVNNWEKHQNVEGMDKIRLQTAERNRKYREKKKQKQLETERDVSVTSRDATDIELELEIELDKESNKDYVGQPDDTIPYKEIISYLNEKANKKFKPATSKYQTLIKARWNEGQRVEDFKKVIDNMVAEWTGTVFSDGKPAENFLQPSTLFGPKFDQYLNTVPKQGRKEVESYGGLEF